MATFSSKCPTLTDQISDILNGMYVMLCTPTAYTMAGPAAFNSWNTQGLAEAFYERGFHV